MVNHNPGHGRVDDELSVIIRFHEMTQLELREA
jgi:hypothetical protein